MNAFSDIGNFVVSNPVLSGIIASSIVYFYRKIGLNVKLNTFSKVRNAKKVNLPPEIMEQIKSIDENKLVEKGLNENFIIFFKRLTDKIPEDRLITLKNNLDTIKVTTPLKHKITKKFREVTHIQKKVLTRAAYHIKKNKVIIYDEVYPIHFFHELLHMATTVKKEDIIYSGLAQKSNRIVFGHGINEGVTQMLTEKYFADYSNPFKNRVPYPYETMIAKSLSKIIGEDFLEDKYFKNDLDSVINELAKYSSYERAKQFIIDMDFLEIFAYKNDKTLIGRKEKVRQRIDSINEFLIKCYKTKLEMENTENIDSELDKFIWKFEDNVMYPYFDYEFNYQHVINNAFKIAA